MVTVVKINYYSLMIPLAAVLLSLINKLMKRNPQTVVLVNKPEVWHILKYFCTLIYMLSKWPTKVENIVP